MKIDISNITKAEGAAIDLDFNEPILGTEVVGEEFRLDSQVNFNGQLIHIGGILKLNGHLKLGYTTVCYKCLKEIPGQLDININESFISGEIPAEMDAYSYENNTIEIDKVLVDNIILSLPMKQICERECKGLCQRCGRNLNFETCVCENDESNPKMEALKNYFEN